MRRTLSIALALLVLNVSNIFSQSRFEIKNNFYEAESWLLYEAYRDALPLYQSLLRYNPSNANYKYRIGQCYLNISGEKDKAIRYLEEAVQDINPKYNEGSFRENGAPQDALYYLANAYRINNQLDNAIKTYKLFKENMDLRVYDSVVVNLQIQSCYNAKELMAKPHYLRARNLGNVINGANPEFSPVVSDNEDMIVFMKAEAFYDAILYSTKVNGRWTPPQNMNEVLRVDRDLFPTSLSHDGKTLYMYNPVGYDGDIYTSTFENGTWTPIVKLNSNINTKYWESHATISRDNQRLYFTSNRRDSYGGLDIYVSKRDSTGDWGVAENLGPMINTPYNEESPFLTMDDKTLYFSSRGHYNMGGHDVFYSTLVDGQWSVPTNAGYPLNTTDDDEFFHILNDGYLAYYSMSRPGGFGKEDIYRVEIFDDAHPRKFFVTGITGISGLTTGTGKDIVKISFTKNNESTPIQQVSANPETGKFEAKDLPHGNYNVTFEADGGEKLVKPLNLLIDLEGDTVTMTPSILTRADLIADLKIEKVETKGDTVIISLKLEPESVLDVEHWVGDSLISKEQFFVNDTALIHKKQLKDGENKIIFTLTDKNDNTTSADVSVTKDKDSVEQPVVDPEYSRVISKKQVSDFSKILENRSTGEMTDLIKDANLDEQQFGTIDDIIAYLKEEARKKGIDSEEVDKLALKVALYDNILTQAAVDLLAKYAVGDMKKILEDIDINELGLKTWTDLQNYVERVSGGKYTGEDLNNLAEDILAGIDPGIRLMRNKILVYSDGSDQGGILKESVNATDVDMPKVREAWLQKFKDETLDKGLTMDQFADLVLAISSLPGTTVNEYLNDLIEYSEEPFTSYLKSLNLRKAKVKTPTDLLNFLFSDKNKGKYSDDDLYKTLANLIIAKDLSDEAIKANQAIVPEKEGGKLWGLWLGIGAGLLFFIIFFARKKKKKKEEEE